MKMLNRLKDTMSRQDKALNDLNQIQSKSMSPVGIPGHGPRSISTNLNPGLSKIGNTRDAIQKWKYKNLDSKWQFLNITIANNW